MVASKQGWRHDPDAPRHQKDPTASRAGTDKTPGKGIAGRGGHDPDAPGYQKGPTASRKETNNHAGKNAGKDMTKPPGYLGDSSEKPDVIEQLVTEFVEGKILSAIFTEVVARNIGLGVPAPSVPGSNDTMSPSQNPDDNAKKPGRTNTDKLR